MATIKQIANLAGVSRGTVDRVLNNRGIVNPETAAKIREIAATMQYSPNKVAKTLAIKKKKLLFGYILFSGTRSNPFFDDVVTGIKAKARELEEYGVTVLIRYSDFDNVTHQLCVIDELLAQGISGLAITPVNHPDVAKKLSEIGIPVVTVNTDIDHSGRLAYVGSNYAQSGKTAGGLMRLVTGGQANVGVAAVAGMEGVPRAWGRSLSVTVRVEIRDGRVRRTRAVASMRVDRTAVPRLLAGRRVSVMHVRDQ